MRLAIFCLKKGEKSWGSGLLKIDHEEIQIKSQALLFTSFSHKTESWRPQQLATTRTEKQMSQPEHNSNSKIRLRLKVLHNVQYSKINVQSLRWDWFLASTFHDRSFVLCVTYLFNLDSVYMSPGAKSKSMTGIEGTPGLRWHMSKQSHVYLHKLYKSSSSRKKLKLHFDIWVQKQLFFTQVDLGGFLSHYRPVTSSLKTPPLVNPPSVNDVAVPSWKSLSPAVFCFVHSLSLFGRWWEGRMQRRQSRCQCKDE